LVKREPVAIMMPSQRKARAQPQSEVRRGLHGRERELIAWWLIFTTLVAIGVLFWQPRLLLVTLLLWCLYEFCLVPTKCRVKTRQGVSCMESVRGRAFAHSKPHQSVKNDGLWKLIGRSNPSHVPAGGGAPRDTGVVLVSPKFRGRLAEEDRIILYLAGAGTLVALIGMFWGLF
jgi:hypothetical protein